MIDINRMSIVRWSGRKVAPLLPFHYPIAVHDRPIDPYDARLAICELLDRVGRADRDALGQLYRLTSASLFGICLRICGERSGAEDVLHEVFNLVWKRADGYVPGKAHPMSWLGTIARNRSIDWVRAHTARRARPLEDAGNVADDGPDQYAQMARSQEAQRLHDCLDALDERQRDTLRTAFFNGLTYAQLATARGVPEPTVRSWARRGLLSLKGCVGGD